MHWIFFFFFLFLFFFFFFFFLGLKRPPGGGDDIVQRISDVQRDKTRASVAIDRDDCHHHFDRHNRSAVD